MNPIDDPWCVVTISRKERVAVWTRMSREDAIECADRLLRNHKEAHVVALPDLLAWVRANAREGT